MKLKKIASLMLAGVMAVSMLAGCSTVSEKPEEPTDPETPSSSATYAEMLESELTGSAKAMVTPVADADLDSALKNAVDKYFDYNSDWATKPGIDSWADHIKYDHLADYRNDVVGEAVKGAMGADYKTITAFNNTLDKTKSAIEVYALPASTSDAYALELLAKKIDEATSNLPSEGGFDKLNGTKANYDYDYTVAVSIETRTVTFAGVEQGVKYVALLMTNNVTEKA